MLDERLYRLSLFEASPSSGYFSTGIERYRLCTSLAEEIENRYEVEKGEELQLSRRLQQLEESLASKPVDLTSFRKLQNNWREIKNHQKQPYIQW